MKLNISLQTIQLSVNKKKEKTLFDIMAVISCIILFLGISTNESMMNMAAVAFLAIFVLLPIDNNICMLIFFSFFTATVALNVGGVTISALLQMVLIIKIIFKKKSITRTVLVYMIVLSLLQIIAMLFCKQTLHQILIMLLNFTLMIMLSLYRSHILSAKKIQWYFLAGVLAMLVDSIFKQPDFWTDTGYRFSGLWTDENFLGLLCCIGLLFCYEIIKQKVLLVVSIPAMLFIAYCGYRTYSMTFVVAIVVLGVISFISIFRSKVKLIVKIVVVVFVMVIFVYAFRNYLITIVDSRLINNLDLTHGRSDTYANAITAWWSHFNTILFGIGFENTANYTGSKASHSTYIDLFTQFGLIGLPFILGLFIFCIGKNNLRIKELVGGKSTHITIILLYGLTLSLLSFDFMYLLFGITGILSQRGEE